MRLDHDGTLSAITEGGLSRLKDGRITTLRSSNGLPCDSVYWMMEDDARALWLYDLSLVGIARSELDAWVTDPKRTIQVAVFDSSDGVPAVPLLGCGPQVAETSDGKLWFRSFDGVSVVIEHLAFNNTPSPVHIEQIVADRRTRCESDAKRPAVPALIRDWR